VTSGTTIGDRCVIGAGSVVTHDIEPHSIAAGAPARVIGKVDYPADTEGQAEGGAGGEAGDRRGLTSD
jgi:acetyltransferase-like isoleucine patch superfamily enzyme